METAHLGILGMSPLPVTAALAGHKAGARQGTRRPHATATNRNHMEIPHLRADVAKEAVGRRRRSAGRTATRAIAVRDAILNRITELTHWAHWRVIYGQERS